MKNYSKLLLIIIFFNVSAAFANDEKYIAAMQKNIDALYKAQDPAAIQNVVNALDRIAAAEKTKWEPQYYIGYGYVMMAFRESDKVKKDSYLDLSLAAINKGKELLPNDSEFAALEGFVHMIRVTVDPPTRGPQFGRLSMEMFEKSLALNPENPRALALKAQMQYGTAKFFGQSTTEACTTLNASLTKFETFKSENVLAPTWGKIMADGMKEDCK
ncbi:hypothetical protein DQQ10_25490 [Pseudochryseolinea flava]|uniref:Tetratricopeptide repeat protein n=2 Tax=Pseudochryseolinea flava TaxID=2059302 RepID=A0A364XVG6_9BACT|nr:hypothetical protein DQQ10_25490 [Pseudochryseolinea flava]